MAVVAALSGAVPRAPQETVFIGAEGGGILVDDQGEHMSDAECVRLGVAALVQQGGVSSEWESEADAMLAWCVLHAAGYLDASRSTEFTAVLEDLAVAGFIERKVQRDTRAGGFLVTPSQTWRKWATVAVLNEVDRDLRGVA